MECIISFPGAQVPSPVEEALPVGDDPKKQASAKQPKQPRKKPQRGSQRGGGQRRPRQEQRPAAGGSMADALKRAGLGR